MSDYSLGIDMGTTYTAAALVTGDRAEMASLATHAVVVPTVAWMGSEGNWLVGASAERRGMTDPSQLTRFFKRRFGDSSPLVLGSSPVSIEHVTAEVLKWVLAQVAEQQGGPPSTVAISHPAPWGEYKLDLLRGAAAEAGVAGASLVAEPVAAAIHYESERGIAEGDLVAVYDFGGGTFDASVLRCTGDGFELAGQPDGIERLGGIDLDAAILAHVRRSVGSDDPIESASGDAAAVRLREECRSAKEALSEDSETSISYVDDRGEQLVRITRTEFEEMCRSPIRQTLSLMSRVIKAAGVTPADLSTILLVGGSSRVPLVAEMVSAEFGRPVATDAHPKHAVALGAARLASRPSMDGMTGTVPVVPLAGAAAAAIAVAGDDEPLAGSTTPAPATGPTGATESARSAGRSVLLAAGALGAILLIGVLAWRLWPDSDPPPVKAAATFECCPLEGLGWPSGALPLLGGITTTFGEVGVRSSSDGVVWSFGAELEPLETRSIGGQLMEVVTVGGELGTELWVSDIQENRVVGLDSATLEPVAEIPVGIDPQGLILASDGSLWVANSGDSTVSVIDPAARSVSATIEVPDGPTSLSTDGTSVWVTSTEADSVSEVGINARTLDSTVPVGDGPTSAVPLGGRVYVTNALDGTVTVLDGGEPDATGSTVDTDGAVGIASSLVAGHVAVVTGDSGAVAMIDPATGQLVASVSGVERSAGVLETVTDSAQLVWVSDFDNGSVTAYPLGALDDALADADPGGTVADIGERQIEVGGSPRNITPIEGGVLVELFAGGQVAFIDEVDFSVTLLSPGHSREGPLVTSDTTNDTTGQTSQSTTTVTETTEAPVEVVPNVAGMTESQAQATLQAAGFSVSTSTAFSGTVPQGLVISSSPGASSEAPAGSTVTIRVSKGPRVTTPNLTVPDQVVGQ